MASKFVANMRSKAPSLQLVVKLELAVDRETQKSSSLIFNIPMPLHSADASDDCVSQTADEIKKLFSSFIEYPNLQSSTPSDFGYDPYKALGIPATIPEFPVEFDMGSDPKAKSGAVGTAPFIVVEQFLKSKVSPQSTPKRSSEARTRLLSDIYNSSSSMVLNHDSAILDEDNEKFRQKVAAEKQRAAMASHREALQLQIDEGRKRKELEKLQLKLEEERDAVYRNGGRKLSNNDKKSSQNDFNGFPNADAYFNPQTNFQGPEGFFADDRVRGGGGAGGGDGNYSHDLFGGVGGGVGGGVAERKPRPPSEARSRLLSDVYGSNVLNHDPSTAHAQQEQWRPCTRQGYASGDQAQVVALGAGGQGVQGPDEVRQRQRAADREQKEALQQQIVEAQRRKERERAQGLEDDAKNEVYREAVNDRHSEEQQRLNTAQRRARPKR